MRYLVDTDWLIDVYIGRQGQAQVLEELGPLGLGVSIVSHGELFEGASGMPDTTDRLARIYALPGRFETVFLDDAIMETFGRTRSELRRAGQLIGDFDLLVGSTAIAHGLVLLTRHIRHFSRIADLRLYSTG